MILSTAYFPNIQYVGKFKTPDRPLHIEAWENYQKQSYRNRCEIMTAQGKTTLTVPVIWQQRTLIRDVRIDYALPWQRTHWRAIASSYKSSPYFDHYGELISPLLGQRHKFLWDLNMQVLSTLLDIFGLSNHQPVLTERYEKDMPDDFRNSISPKERLRMPDPDFRSEPYYQVFGDRLAFESNLSVLDYLFCEGAQLL